MITEKELPEYPNPERLKLCHPFGIGFCGGIFCYNNINPSDFIPNFAFCILHFALHLTRPVSAKLSALRSCLLKSAVLLCCRIGGAYERKPDGSY